MSDRRPGDMRVERAKSEANRWAVAALLVAALAQLAMPTPAQALTYTFAPGTVFNPAGAPPSGALPLTGSFDVHPAGVCPLLCEPDAYVVSNVVLRAGGELLLSGVLEPLGAVELVFPGPSFEELTDGSIRTGAFPIERTIIQTGTLIDDPHHHTDYQTFIELSFGIVEFIGDDPREILYDDPRGTFPRQVTLAYALIERTGTARFGNDGSGILYANEIDYDEPTVFLGATTFTAVPVPEPGTDALLGLGLLGLACKRPERRQG